MDRTGGAMPIRVVTRTPYHPPMLFILWLVVRLLTRVLVLPGADEATKDLQILVLQQQLRVLRRTAGHRSTPRWSRWCGAWRGRTRLALGVPLPGEQRSTDGRAHAVRRRDVLGGLIHEYQAVAA